VCNKAKNIFTGFKDTMKISFNPNVQFCSNTRVYRADDGNPVGTYTRLFRADLDWKKATDFMVKHFKDKENVQILQFGASDGSEAYTQIISLLENHSNVDKFFPIKAYDIDEEICKASKSGLLNINITDQSRFDERRIDFEKYFKKSDKELNIDGDKLKDTSIQTKPSKTFKVSKTLTDKVNFHHADMFDILREHNDNSNTVIMCRNVLLFFSDREIDHFTTLAAYKLKKGSLFITGEHDQKTNLLLEIKGFIRVMPNVYMKA